MNKLPIALLVGAMATSTWAMADTPITQNSQSKAKDCAELSGKKKDKCVQATPAGPVVMTTGKQKKGKSEIAKDRERKPGTPEPDPSAQGSDIGQKPAGGEAPPATTGRSAESGKTQ